MSSLSTFATPVAVGVGVVIIGVLLLMRERRSNSSPVASNSAAAEMTASSAPALVRDASSARALLDALDEALLHVDHSGVIVEVNRAGSELLGLPVSSIVGSPFDNWLDEPDRGALGP